MKLSNVFLASSILASAILAVSCASSKKGGDSQSSDSSKSAAQVSTKTPSLSGDMKTIYFDFNKYDIRADQKPNATKLADYLKENGGSSIRIAGHTDDRGSREYNIALGQKRAKSLENFLKASGVSNSIETISYGKERPAVQEQNETAWAKNRRDEVEILK